MLRLKSYTDALFSERDKRHVEQILATRKALDLARENLEKRLDLLNDLRNGVITRTEYETKHNELERRLSSIEGQSVTRTEYETKHGDLYRRLTILENWKSNITGRIVVSAVIGGVIVASVGALIGHILR